jgi:hypothetical protein
MTARLAFCVLAGLLMANPLWAQQPMLRGEVVLVDENAIRLPQPVWK